METDTFRNNSSQSRYPYCTHLARITSIPDYDTLYVGWFCMYLTQHRDKWGALRIW